MAHLSDTYSRDLGSMAGIIEYLGLPMSDRPGDDQRKILGFNWKANVTVQGISEKGMAS
jgi:hypothetical protein